MKTLTERERSILEVLALWARRRTNGDHWRKASQVVHEALGQDDERLVVHALRRMVWHGLVEVDYGSSRPRYRVTSTGLETLRQARRMAPRMFEVVPPTMAERDRRRAM